MKRITLSVEDDVYQRLRNHAADRKATVDEFVRDRLPKLLTEADFEAVSACCRRLARPPDILKLDEKFHARSFMTARYFLDTNVLVYADPIQRL